MNLASAKYKIPVRHATLTTRGAVFSVFREERRVDVEIDVLLTHIVAATSLGAGLPRVK